MISLSPMREYVDRTRQIRDIIEENPGISGKEVAERMGLTPGRVSQLVSSMRDHNEILQKREGRNVGLHLTDSAIRRRILRRRWTS